jgi:outer membrane protein TolC
MKTPARIFCVFLPLTLFSTVTAAREDLPTVTIGVLLDGPLARLQEVPETIEREITNLLSSDFSVRIPARERIEADWTVAGVTSGLDQLLADREVDMIVVVGSIGTHVATQRGRFGKPVVALPVYLPQIQELAAREGSGIRNLHFLTVTQRPDIGVLREITPCRRVAVFIEGALARAIPGIIDRMEEAAKEYELSLQLIEVDTTIEPALEALGPDVEAVYVLPLHRISPADFGRLVSELQARQLPSFSSVGRPEVDLGILAGLKPPDFLRWVARRTALNTQRILQGIDPREIPVAFSSREALSINMATARAIEVYPKWKVLTEAELVEEDVRRVGRKISLEDAVREAVEVNLELAVRERDLAAGAEDVRLATANLLPQIDVSANGVIIDEDRAEASFGSATERTLTGSATLTQLLYSEPGWANRTIQKSLQEARELDRDALRLDIAFDAAVTYLDILRAKTFERIQRENLDLTRTNLELARVRESIGTATPGEVYRWENQIANARQAVIDASAQRNRAEIELNRLLHRPLEEPFRTTDAYLEDPVLMTSQRALFRYMDNPWGFRVFRRFMAKEALESAPELRALDAAVAAQERALASASRRFWIPTLGLQVNVTETIERDGAGSGEFSGLGLLDLPRADDTDWFVGVNLSYPLFEGGARFADKKQAQENLARIETEREVVAERVEQRVRSALHDMGASLAGIDLSSDAAEAARKNYELVLEAYRRGAISILDLLDAQNVALVSDEAAANAVYAFLIDLMSVQRAAGRLDFFCSVEERQAFFERLESFFREAGDAPAGR